MPFKSKKKKSKIIRRRPGEKQKMYFTTETTAAIDEYQKCLNADEKEKIYMTMIYPAFDKLAENLIFMHGFKGLHDSELDLKNDCITFLYETIKKFDPLRGSKAFSYFNVVAKNWLIIKSKQRTSKLRKNVSIDSDQLSDVDKSTIEMHHIVPAQDDQLESVEFVIRVHSLLEKIKDLAISENEIKCIDAITQIFKTINNESGSGSELLLNKRAVFFMMREISGLNPKQLTTTVASLKKHYKSLKNHDECGIY